MRKALKLLLLLILLPIAAHSQTHTFPATDTNNTFTGTNIFTGSVETKLITYTVATLPLPASVFTGMVVIVNDASVAGSCSLGSGSGLSFCRNSGSAWVAIGGGIADYQTVQSNGSSLPAQPVLNFVDGGDTTAVCVDNPGSGSTDCHINSTSGEPGGSNGNVQYNNSGSFGGASGLITDGTNLKMQGPDPWFDPAWYGARGVYPAITTTTSCVNGSPTITPVSVANFMVNDGIIAYQCGAANVMTTPGAPTVTSGHNKTPMVPDAMINSVTGASTYIYNVFGIGKDGSITPAGATTTITTGQASLGVQTCGISSESLTGTTLTITTSGACPILVGAYVYYMGSTDATLHGLGNIATAATPVFTITGMTVQSAAALTSTGGTLYYVNSNSITWTPHASVWEYGVCVKRPGDGAAHFFTLGMPTSTNNYPSTYTVTDYGATASAAPTVPAFINDADCTGSGSPGNLVAKIVSIGASTILLDTNATQTTSGKTLMSTDGPALKAAVAAADATQGGIVYIPQFLNIQNFTDLHSYQYASVIQNNIILLGETLWIPPQWQGLLSGGAVSQFQQKPAPVVYVAGAHPAMYSTWVAGPFISALSFKTLDAENQVLMLLADTGGQGGHYSNLSFVTGATGDHAGIGMAIRPGIFSCEMDHMNFVSGPGLGPGSSFAPSLFYDYNNSGVTSVGCDMSYMHFSERAFVELMYGSGLAPNNIDHVWTQAGYMPSVTIQNLIGDTPYQPNYFSFIMDTSVMPNFSFHGGISAQMTVGAMGDVSSGTGGRAPNYSGVAPKSIFTSGVQTTLGAITPPSVGAFTNSSGLVANGFFVPILQATGQMSTTIAIGTTSTNGVGLYNPTTATVGAQKWSPRVHYQGSGWKTDATAAGETVDFISELKPIQGTATPTLEFQESAQVNGAGYTVVRKITQAGNETLTGTLTVAGIPSAGAIGSGTPSTGAFTTISATGVITSTLATGTAPFTIASTTPVANLTAVPTTYNHSATQQTATHIVQDTCTLGTDCSITLTGAAVFTNATSYTCVAQDETAAAATKCVQSSGSALVITGTGTDVIRYILIGN